MKVGITGGIATGKTTVCEMFKGLGAHIFDADHIAKRLVKKGEPVWKSIVDHFGDHILSDNNEIDRNALGDIVFGNVAERRALERIVHPAVFLEMEEKRRTIFKVNPDALVLFDIPLLFETGRDYDLDEIILVYLPATMQLARLIKRDCLSKQDALMRINSQMPIEEKRMSADRIIDNSGTLNETYQQVVSIFSALKPFIPEGGGY